MANEYNWTIDCMYNMDFYDFLQIYKRSKERKENQAIAEMRKLQMLTVAIHTGEPDEFIQELEDAINENPSKDLVGDLDGLENLKYKREQYRMAGDM